MPALSFRQNDLATLCTDHNIRVVVDKAIDIEVMSLHNTVPPADIGQGSHVHHQLPLQCVHIGLRLIERLPDSGRIFCGRDIQRQMERGLANNLLRFQPQVKPLPAGAVQQGFNLRLDLSCEAQRGLLQRGQLIFIHLTHDQVNIGLQLPGVNAIHLIQLVVHDILTLLHPALRRQGVEISFEILLVGAGHFQDLGRTALRLGYIHLGNLIIGGGEVNVVGLAFQGKAYR